MIKRGEAAPFTGVLVPELNYRNYKSFEGQSFEFNQALHGDGLPLCGGAPDPLLDSPIFWGVVGALLGAGATVWAFH